MAKFATVDEYIGSLPHDVRHVFAEVRQSVLRAVPSGEEKISYQMPTLTLDGKNVVHYAAWKDHISVYPVPSGDDALAQEIAPYAAGKGTVKFPLDQPVPYALIERIANRLATERMPSKGHRA